MKRNGMMAALLSISMVFSGVMGNTAVVCAENIKGSSTQDVVSAVDDPLADKEAIASDIGITDREVEVKYADWGSPDKSGVMNTSSGAAKHQVVFVLDSSGSMSGTPMKGLKAACKGFISDFFKNDPNTQIAIIDYGSSVTVHRFSGEYFSSDTDELITAIDSLNASGGTPMNQGLFKADELLSGSKAAKKYIIQMADGNPNEGSSYTGSGARYNKGEYVDPDGNLFSYPGTHGYESAVYETFASIESNYSIYAVGFFHSLSGTNKQFAATFMNDIQNMGYKEASDNRDLNFNFEDIAEEINEDIKVIRSSINGKGKANYCLKLTDKSGNVHPNAEVKYQFYDENRNPLGEMVTDTTNSEGEVLIQSPYFNNEDVNGEPFKKTCTAKVTTTEAGIDEIGLKFDITVNPLSFKQKGSLRDKASLEASIGEQAGIKLGPVKAEAAVAKAAVKGGVGSTLSASHEYSNGKRKLELENKYDANIGVNGELGPTGEATAIGSAEISAFTVEGEAVRGASVKAGKKIENYDPENPQSLKDIGKFMLGTTAVAHGNAFLVGLANAMGADIYNLYGEDAYVHLNAGANVLDVAIKDGEGKDADKLVSGAFGKVEYDSTYTYGAEQDTTKSGFTRTMEKDSAVTGTLAELTIEPIGWTGTPDDWTEDYFVQRYSLEASDDKFELVHQVSKDDIETKWVSASRETKEKYTYNSDDLSELYSSVPEIGRFANGNLMFILDSAFGDMHKKLKFATPEADYARTISNKTELSTGDLDLGLKLELGLDLGVCFSGIDESSYEIQSGTFKDGITSVTAVNDIDSLVENNKTNILTILKEAISGAADDAVNYVKKVAGKVGEAINNVYCDLEFLVNDVKGRCLNIVSLIKGDKTETLDIKSYTLTTFEKINISGRGSLSATGDVLKGEAISVGDPYYAFVTGSDGKETVEDFSDTPVKLTLSYTDEMLDNIGAGPADEENIEIFKYSEKEAAYFSLGGTVDAGNNKVSTTITEPGQFILAINRELTGVVEEEDILSKTSSQTYTVGADTYTVSWNSFVQYDGRVHNGTGMYASGALYDPKETKSKAYDLKVCVLKNGEVVDPSAYSVKTKNNKAASVSIDGITAIQTNSKKLPSFTLKFKGKEFKEANAVIKKEALAFGIIPVELKQEAVTFDKVKTGKDNTVEIKKITFKPGYIQKPLKLKYNKKANKTDYVTEVQGDGSVVIIGKNNYYGSVIYRK